MGNAPKHFPPLNKENTQKKLGWVKNRDKIIGRVIQDI